MNFSINIFYIYISPQDASRSKGQIAEGCFVKASNDLKNLLQQSILKSNKCKILKNEDDAEEYSQSCVGKILTNVHQSSHDIEVEAKACIDKENELN